MNKIYPNIRPIAPSPKMQVYVIVWSLTRFGYNFIAPAFHLKPYSAVADHIYLKSSSMGTEYYSFPFSPKFLIVDSCCVGKTPEYLPWSTGRFQNTVVKSVPCHGGGVFSTAANFDPRKGQSYHFYYRK